MSSVSLSGKYVLALLLTSIIKFKLISAVAPPLTVDRTAILDVIGDYNVRFAYTDSYSSGGNCYCLSTFDHDVGLMEVDTPLGIMTVQDICDLIGPGPGYKGNPIYNDIQCGNGPSNSYDEVICPGRTDHGKEGCNHIGPKWNLTAFLPPVVPSAMPSPSPSLVTEAPASEPSTPLLGWVKVPPPIYIPQVDSNKKEYKNPTASPTISPAPSASEAPSTSLAPTNQEVSLRIDTVTVDYSFPGEADVNTKWMDSYSVGDNCYCKSITDIGRFGLVRVDTPLGPLTVQEICVLLGPGPGSFGRPKYNDIQCGNGPWNRYDDNDEYEGTCPGRVDRGPMGCRYIGPKWNFQSLLDNKGIR